MRLAAASSRIASRQREFSDARYRASGTCSASPCPTTTSAPPTSSTAPQHRRHQTPQRSLPQRRAISALSGPSWALNSLGGDSVPGSTASGLRDRPLRRAQHRFCCAAAPARRTHGRHWPKRVGQSPRDPGELASLADRGPSRGWRNTPRSPRPPACRSASAIRIAPASAGAALHQFVKRSELRRACLCAPIGVTPVTTTHDRSGKGTDDAACSDPRSRVRRA